MKLVLIILLILLSLEVPLFFIFIALLGGAAALLVMVGTAMLGCLVIFRGFNVARFGIRVRNQGPEEILRILGAFYFILVGVLMISPGFLCDVIGLCLLIPTLRLFLIKVAWKFLRQRGFLEEEGEGRYFYFRWSKNAPGKARQPPKSRPDGRVSSSDYEVWESHQPPDPKSVRDAEFEHYGSDR